MSAITKLENLEDGEVLFSLDISQIAFYKDSKVDYSPIIKTLIRIMDNPKDDIYHYYIVQRIPEFIHVGTLHYAK